MNTLRGHKYAILLVALLFVTVVKSFSQQLPHPVFVGLAMMATTLLVLARLSERQ